MWGFIPCEALSAQKCAHCSPFFRSDTDGVWQRWCVTKMCVTKMCVKDGVWQSCVWKTVFDKDVCERRCVTKMCVKDSVWSSCVWGRGGGGEGGGGGGGGGRYRSKNKSPTQFMSKDQIDWKIIFFQPSIWILVVVFETWLYRDPEIQTKVNDNWYGVGFFRLAM